VVKTPLRARSLSLGHARMLVGLTSKEQEYFVHQTLNEEWSVRQLEQAVKLHKKTKTLDPTKNKDQDVLYLQNQLSEQLGAPVQIISDVTEGGWIKVKFFNNETLSGLLDRLGLRYD
jgi:ParB family chromosome partitioning protein